MKKMTLVAMCAVCAMAMTASRATATEPATAPTPAAKPVQTEQTVYWIIANTPDAIARCQSSGGTVSQNEKGETICTVPASKLHRRWTH